MTNRPLLIVGALAVLLGGCVNGGDPGPLVKMTCDTFFRPDWSPQPGLYRCVDQAAGMVLYTTSQGGVYAVPLEQTKLENTGVSR